MEINKTIILIIVFMFTALLIGNMVSAFYFTNRAINLIQQQAPPLTISKIQANSLKKLVKS